jgi:Uma2 family endonuclease
MATAETRLLTAEEFWEWLTQRQDDGLYELERGEIVAMPSPGELHGAVCWLISFILGGYVFQRNRGYLCSNDTGLIVERNPDTVRGPDLMLFDETKQLDDLNRKFAQQIPRLVVEVLSPTDQTTRTNRRIGQYLRMGVPLVWLVDPEVRSVSLYRPDKYPVVLDESEELVAEDVLPGFKCRVSQLFQLPGTTHGQ